MGPHRVLPGRLSVTRTFGDIEAKLPEFGGNPRAIIATPEIRSFKLTKDNDFIILGCKQFLMQAMAYSIDFQTTTLLNVFGRLRRIGQSSIMCTNFVEWLLRTL